MSDAAVRVALLGRAGKARDQLHRALAESGVAIVAEGDPAELDPATVAGLSPTCYLVSLEPAIERSLERFDDLLAASGVEVMFDDAETSAQLDGWDLNRWARHIANKLLGHDGLPPVPAGSLYGYEDAPPEAASESAGTGPAPLSPSSTAVDDDDSDDLSDSIAVDAFGESDTGLDFDALDVELGSLDFASPRAGAGASKGNIDELADSIAFSGAARDGELDFDVAELSAQLEANQFPGARMPSRDTTVDDDFRIEAIDAIAVAADDAPAGVATEASARPVFDFGDLSLAPADEAMHVPDQPSFGVESTTDLRLAPISGHDGLGAVVILAGLGGPDAVRQLLASLPDELSVPVLLYQHLEVGKHERLVEQLAKISKLPVVLAKSGDSPDGGKVTLLPAGMTAIARGDVLVFAEGDLVSLLMSVPPRESMVVVLSGANPALVPTILAIRDAGGLALAQDPEVCFDAAAAEALQGQGIAVMPALGLARRIAERWST